MKSANPRNRGCSGPYPHFSGLCGFSQGTYPGLTISLCLARSVRHLTTQETLKCSLTKCPDDSLAKMVSKYVLLLDSTYWGSPATTHCKAMPQSLQNWLITIGFLGFIIDLSIDLSIYTHTVFYNILYIYVCMYVCMYVCIYIYMCVFCLDNLFIYLFMIYLFIYLFISTVCVCGCVYSMCVYHIHNIPMKNDPCGPAPCRPSEAHPGLIRWARSTGCTAGGAAGAILG